MRNLIVFFTVSAILCASPLVAAENKVVVIPLMGSAGNLNNVITVSPKGGDFTDPVAAVNSISGNSSNNRYVVLIGPGEYTLSQPLVMKAYVDVRGSGMDATKLIGAISSNTLGSSSAMVVGATYTWLSDLYIRNSGGNSYSIGIYNNGATLDITRVEVDVWGGTGTFGASGNYAIYNGNSSHSRISDSKLFSMGKYAYGIYNNASSPTLNRVNVDAWVDENTNCCGAFGVSSTNFSYPRIHYSEVRGSSYGLQQSGGSIRMNHSILINRLDSGGSPSIKCFSCFDGDDMAISANCYTLTAY